MPLFLTKTGLCKYCINLIVTKNCYGVINMCRAMQYGGLGMAIGHEFTHGFDNNGL